MLGRMIPIQIIALLERARLQECHTTFANKNDSIGKENDNVKGTDEYSIFFSE